MSATLIEGFGPAALQLRDALAAAAERLARSTVQVRGAGGRWAGVGSGVVWRPDGLVVTNAHVVGDARRLTAELSDGRAFPARVLYADPRRDLAALQLDLPPGSGQATGGLPAADVGGDGSVAPPLRVGQLVFALGHPWGVRNTMTTGIVHAVGGRWVQADLRLAPGNSGGPLADAWGRVVGVNSMIVRGLAFAVPAARVARFLDGAARRAAAA